MNSLSVLACMGCTKMIFLSYLYRTIKYVFPLLDMTGYLLVKSVAILCCGFMIFVKT